MKRHLPKLLFLPLVIGLCLAGFFAYAADPTGTNVASGSLVLQARTFATLPATTAGTVAYITDGLAANCADTTCTTFGTSVTGGGGALQLLVWRNGAAWTLIGK